MSQLLDTNVISALTNARVDPAFVAWSERQDRTQQAISVITLAELRFGIAQLPPGNRRIRFEGALDAVIPRLFGDRILDVDRQVADAFGRLLARSQAQGLSVGDRDLILAATAMTYGLTMVTRNVRHFEPLGLSVVDPWAG